MFLLCCGVQSRVVPHVLCSKIANMTQLFADDFDPAEDITFVVVFVTLSGLLIVKVVFHLCLCRSSCSGLIAHAVLTFVDSFDDSFNCSFDLVL